MNTDLEKWYLNLSEKHRVIAMELRELVHAEGHSLREELKWNQPCFYGNSMVCYIQKAKRHVALGFGKGTELADPKELLEGSGSQMRHVKISLDGHLHIDALRELVSCAIKLDCPR